VTTQDARRGRARRGLRADLLAGVPGAISSVPDGMTSSSRMLVVTTTIAAALAAGPR
jgi:hypothetical protein